jgi:UDP-N-acetylglucosamine 2-epimerase (non-hydrolysing)
MPEEINRVLTDQISDLLFITERSAADNLAREGVAADRIHFVGNVMIDTLLQHRERARTLGTLQKLGLHKRQFSVCTLHRPSNVDSRTAAANTVRALALLSARIPVVLPLHPRTRARWEEFGLLDEISRLDVRVLPPLGYLEFLALMSDAALVLTDSGGIQEETTVLGVPCLTFRANTERPITITHGTNKLVGCSPEVVAEATDDILAGRVGTSPRPEMWDGQAAQRIVGVLMDPAGRPEALVESRA